jgi:hypothetical protein
MAIFIQDKSRRPKHKYGTVTDILTELLDIVHGKNLLIALYLYDISPTMNAEKIALLKEYLT